MSNILSQAKNNITGFECVLSVGRMTKYENEDKRLKFNISEVHVAKSAKNIKNNRDKIAKKYNIDTTKKDLETILADNLFEKEDKYSKYAVDLMTRMLTAYMGQDKFNLILDEINWYAIQEPNLDEVELKINVLALVNAEIERSMKAFRIKTKNENEFLEEQEADADTGK